jgi:prepilin-type N-terminal cleavage/methylation domain-containing protein
VGRPGFSVLELITVVAIMAVLVGAALPTASSLFNRQREDLLRENLTVLRSAIADFRYNAIDDDRDGRIDEDARGDMNHDGLPGLRGVDDDADLLADEDWGSRLPFDRTGVPNLSYDWRARADDDEDGVVDEEAFPGDLNEMAAKMPILRKAVPIDPTSGQAAWSMVHLKFNNDSDYTLGEGGKPPFRPGVDPVVQALPAPGSAADTTYVSTSSRILFAGRPAVELRPGDTLTPLVDEDPRNGIDDDGDGQIDEDAPDLTDVRSLNSRQSSNLTTYSSW